MRVFLEEINISIGRLSKEDTSQQCGWAWSNPLTAWIEQKRQRKGECAVCLSWDIHLLLPLGIGTSGSQAFGHGLNYTTSFPRSSNCTGRLWDVSASIIVWTYSYNKSLSLCIYMHTNICCIISLYMYLSLYRLIYTVLRFSREYRIGSVFWRTLIQHIRYKQNYWILNPHLSHVHWFILIPLLLKRLNVGQWSKTQSDCDFSNCLYVYWKYIQLTQPKSSTLAHWLDKDYQYNIELYNEHY